MEAVRDISLKNYEMGIVVINKDGKEEYRLGPTAGQNEEVIGGWAEIETEDGRTILTKVSVEEKKKKPNNNWLMKTAIERAVQEVSIETIQDLLNYTRKFY